MIQYNFPTVLFYGEDSVKELPSAILKQGLKTLLLVTDPGMVQIGLANEVTNTFTASSLKIDIFDGVNPNPIDENVIEGVLKYNSGNPVISSIQRVSKPGRRIFSRAESLPKINNGLGIAIISTPKGVMTDIDARKQKVGGEIICKVF